MMLQHNQSSIFTCESRWRFTSVMTSQVSVANPTVTFIKGPKNNCLIINHHCKPGNRIYFATKHQSGTKYSQLWVFVLAQNSNVKTTSQCLESFFYNPPPQKNPNPVGVLWDGGWGLTWVDLLPALGVSLQVWPASPPTHHTPTNKQHSHVM